MRFATIWDPGAGAPRLCALDGGVLRPVGSYRDFAELVAAEPGVPLAEAAAAAGIGDAAAAWPEVERAGLDDTTPHLLPPVRPAEVWAAGVTYERSRDARTRESGRLDVYERVYDAERPEPYDLDIELRIERAGELTFEGRTSTARLHARLETLTAYLVRENWLAPATVLLTGTGIVPPDDFTLAPGDVVEIVCPAVGTLRNTCAPAAQLAPPAGWF